MVTPALAQHFAKQGVNLIPREAGAQAFVTELCAGEDVQVVLAANPLQDLAGFDTPPTQQASVWFHERNFPLLNGHVIDVPVAALLFVTELAARCVTSLKRDTIRVLRDIPVFKGIQLPDFAGREHWVRLSATALDNGLHQVEFRDTQNRLNYRFSVETGEPLIAPTFTDDPAEFGTQPWDWDMRVIYNERQVLFHSGVFEIVASVGKLGTNSYSHQLVPIQISQDQRWCTDTCMNDGAGQGAVLWAWTQHETHVLPSHLAELRIYQTGLLQDRQYQCYSRVTADLPNQSCFDIYMLDAQGRRVVDMIGGEMTYLPNNWTPAERKREPSPLK